MEAHSSSHSINNNAAAGGGIVCHISWMEKGRVAASWVLVLERGVLIEIWGKAGGSMDGDIPGLLLILNDRYIHALYTLYAVFGLCFT